MYKFVSKNLSFSSSYDNPIKINNFETVQTIGDTLFRICKSYKFFNNRQIPENHSDFGHS